jgi:hypothetical protein
MNSELAMYGILSSESKAVTDAFMYSLRDGTERSIEATQELTKNIGIMSKAMHIDFGKAAEFAIDLSTRFGVAAERVPDILASMTSSVSALNSRLERFKVYNRDFYKSVVEVTSGIQGYNLHMRSLQNLMSAVVVQSERFGLNQQQALKLSQTMAGLVTGKAPEWVRVFAGQDMLGSLLGVRRRGSESWKSALVREFGDLPKGMDTQLMKLRDMVRKGKWSRFAGAEIIETIMRGSDSGIKATFKILRKHLRRMDPAAVRRILGIEDAFMGMQVTNLIQSGKMNEAVKTLKMAKKKEKEAKEKVRPLTAKEYIAMHKKRIQILGTMSKGVEGLVDRLVSKLTDLIVNKVLPFFKDGFEFVVKIYNWLSGAKEELTGGLLGREQYTAEGVTASMSKAMKKFTADVEKHSKAQDALTSQIQDAQSKLLLYAGGTFTPEAKKKKEELELRLGRLATVLQKGQAVQWFKQQQKMAAGQPGATTTRILQSMPTAARAQVKGVSLTKEIAATEKKRATEAIKTNEKIIKAAEKKRTKASDRMFKRTMPKQARSFWAQALDSQRKITRNMMITMMSSQPGGLAALQNIAPGWFQGLTGHQRRLLESGQGAVRMDAAGNIVITRKETLRGGAAMLSRQAGKAVLQTR